MNNIHTFGDSHSQSGFSEITGIIVNWQGPKLCYSIGRDGFNLKNIVKNGDTVIFCFGEIDCRCHIHKHISESNTYKQIIVNITDKYFIAIKNAIVDYVDLKVAVYNVVPPVQKINTLENPEYPFLGSDDERKLYVTYFNERLRDKCAEYNFVFFDIYNDCADINGFLKKTLSDDNVHIKDSTYIKQFINNNLL